MIETSGIKKSYGENHVLRGIDVTIKQGEIVSMIGPSGAGKTTFLRMLNWLEKPDAGSVRIEDTLIDPSTATKRQVRALRAHSAMVFQHYNLYRNKTALENITVPLVYVKKKTRAEAAGIGEILLARVGLWDKKDEYPSRLSGGQQQRVSIARALAINPSVMLFDEPTSSLDPELVEEVLNVMNEIAAEGMTMLVVSHEMRFVRSVSSRVLFLDEGLVLEDAPPEKIFKNPSNPRTRTFLRQANFAPS
ncbi:MAG: amino acid ABC transporter ATP-binding protein [Synergistaceae bacterium]|jgi:ABC-type polar amino acid transport system ATPase subunit|nr:amino acid ABC transporter ATP-binding protein [Synergistaceae bacterium]